MQIAFPRRGRALLAGLVATTALATPGAAEARGATADLRVEGPRAGPLVDARFATGSVRFRTERRHGCGGTGSRKGVRGPTALGLLVDASRAVRRLRPVSISDEFDFGLLVCGIGRRAYASDERFWLYKVDHEAPEVGAGSLELSGGEQVLWYFVDTASGRNTGDELELVAPARARPGRALEVTVYAYDSAGRRSPAEGALVRGGAGVARTDERGVARVRLRPGRRAARLRASRGSDVASALERVCVARRLARCPRAEGERIFGGVRRDRVRGTPGPDVVRTGARRDRVIVRGGDRDRVACGRGRDVVLADRRDRLARNCEVVRRGRRR